MDQVSTRTESCLVLKSKKKKKRKLISYKFVFSGPLDTDMLAYAKSHTADENLRMSFNDMCDKGQVLSCDQSCSVLMKLLLGDSYESGAHVDVYDV